MKDTIVLFASSRRDGNTGKLTDWVAGDLNVEIIDLANKMLSPYDYQHKNMNDDFVSIINQLQHVDKIIFSTPEYWYAPCAQMKVFIDRLSDLLDVASLQALGKNLRSKTAYVLSTSTSEDSTQTFLNSFKLTFEYLGIDFGGYLHANCSDGYRPAEYNKDVQNFLTYFRK